MPAAYCILATAMGRTTPEVLPDFEPTFAGRMTFATQSVPIVYSRIIPGGNDYASERWLGHLIR